MTTAAVDSWRQEEESAWEEVATAADDGRGIELRSVNLNSETDMQEVYDALGVKGPGPKSRFRAYIQRLQTRQQPRPPLYLSTAGMDYDSKVLQGAEAKAEETMKFQQQPHPIGDLAAEMQAMRLEIHGVRESLPAVLVGHVITPSQGSRMPQVVSTIFDSLGLSLTPLAMDTQYQLPASCGKEWTFSWKWKSAASMDDSVLERTSYKPVQSFLQRIGLFCVDISEGQFCVEKLLFNADVYTKRAKNPFLIRGQDVFLRHRVQGRSDLAVLRADNGGDYILRHMIKFVVEIKTVHGYRQSQTGCMREAQLQLIGLNAFNTNNSPPVVLSNLAKTHQVLFLDKDEDWNYSIRLVNCSSFAAAIHFANDLSTRECMSQHFSRPSSPDPNTNV